MRILVCDGDYKHALGIVRSLGRAGHEIHVLSPRPRALCSFSTYCHSEHVIVPYESESFAAELLQIIDSEQIELVIPVGTPSFRTLSRLTHRLIDKTNIVIAEPEAIDFCMSKARVYLHAEQAGISVASTEYPESLDEVDAIADRFQYPCVIKGRYETGYNIIAYAQAPAELRSQYRNLCERYKLREPGDLPMIQRYVDGEGYGFFAIYNRGECGPTFQHHRLREYPPSGGMSVASESSYHDGVFEQGKRLLDSLQWHGVAMVEFRVTADGEPVLMEINPKFWGSLDLALQAGVDFPSAMVAIASGRSVPFAREFRHPFRLHWPLHGDLLHGLRRPSRLPAVLWSCVDPRWHSNLWLRDDLAGTIGIFKTTGGKALRRMVGR